MVEIVSFRNENYVKISVPRDGACVELLKIDLQKPFSASSLNPQEESINAPVAQIKLVGKYVETGKLIAELCDDGYNFKKSEEQHAGCYYWVWNIPSRKGGQLLISDWESTHFELYIADKGDVINTIFLKDFVKRNDIINLLDELSTNSQ